jgi:rhamnulokinase
MTADASGITVEAGLIEATAMGNVLVQAIAAGRFASLAEGREYVRKNTELNNYYPASSSAISEAARRYSEIEARFVAEKAIA